MGEATYLLVATDFAEALQASYRATLTSWRGVLYALVWALALSVVATLVMLGLWPGPWEMTFVATALSVVSMLILYMILNYHVFLPAAAERLFRNMRGGEGPATLVWTDAEVTVTSPRGQFISRWTDFDHYLETPRLLVLLPVPGNSIYVVPRAALGDAGLSDIRGHLARHAVRRAGGGKA